MAKLQIAPTRSKMIQRIPKRRRYRRHQKTQLNRNSKEWMLWDLEGLPLPQAISSELADEAPSFLSHSPHVFPCSSSHLAASSAHVACNRFWQPMYACITCCAMSLGTHLLHFALAASHFDVFWHAVAHVALARHCIGVFSSRQLQSSTATGPPGMHPKRFLTQKWEEKD